MCQPFLAQASCLIGSSRWSDSSLSVLNLVGGVSPVLLTATSPLLSAWPSLLLVLPPGLSCWESVLLCLPGLGIGLPCPLPPLPPLRLHAFRRTCMRGNQPRPSVNGTWTSVLLVIAQALRLVAAAIERAVSHHESTVVSSEARQASEAPGTPRSEWDLLSSGVADSSVPGTGFAIDLSEPPAHVFDLCRGLGTDQRSRAIRAWQAGLWARAVLDGHVSYPAPTPHLGIRNTIYIVLQAPGTSHTAPVRVHSSTAYFRLVQNLQNLHRTDGLSHAFPSVSEAKAYCLGAGVPYPDQAT